ncbi:MAG: YkgJ family cysteine cluster protein [Verrucomicrobiales bacterium]|nr:YkgJ family cysteine cluster protein [Verrucomicrobiales bacterium]
MPETNAPLKYVCQRCGNCCRVPGDVRVSEQEIGQIAAHLGLDTPSFIARFTRLRVDRTGLALEDHPDGACIFLDGNSCTIQPVKPGQCRGFPNTWRYPGWRQLSAATPARSAPAAS